MTDNNKGVVVLYRYGFDSYAYMSQRQQIQFCKHRISIYDVAFLSCNNPNVISCLPAHTNAAHIFNVFKERQRNNYFRVVVHVHGHRKSYILVVCMNAQSTLVQQHVTAWSMQQE